MILKHSTHHIWIKNYTDRHILNYYSKSDQKKIQRLIEKAEQFNISYKFDNASDSFFNWFQEFYENILKDKYNPKTVNIKQETVDKPNPKLTYKTLTIFHLDKIVGGLIFSDRGEHFSIAYRAFNYGWDNISQIASPSLYAEYLIDCYSIESKKKKIIHGQDRHPYGLNSSIGLAIFKLSVGCRPYLPKVLNITETDTLLYNRDMLIFEIPNNGEGIRNGHLVLKENNKEKYSQLFKFADILSIETHHEYE